MVDCNGPTEAYRLCFREPKNCTAEAIIDTQGTRRKRQTNGGSLDDVFSPSKKIERETKAKEARAAYSNNFKKMNLQKSYTSLFEILWYTQLPCFDVEGVTSSEKDQYGMLKGCFWKGYAVPCSKIFDTFPTDRGMCCTFNMESAEKMFKKGKYQERVLFMQNRDKNLSFDRTTDMPERWFKNNEPVSEAGRSKGLQVILDSHSNLLSGGTVGEDFDGFYAIIDGKNQYPMTTRKTVLLRPGHNNFVSMSATNIESSDIDDIDPEKRKCLFEKDKDMSVHQNYTQSNCLLECQLNYALFKVRNGVIVP